MELKDLVGKHLLSGVDITSEKGNDLWDETCDVVRFVIDGITYKAIEDPEDGYRSYIKELSITKEKVSNTFPPQKVIGVMKEESDCDTIQFFDSKTKNIVLEVGTEDTNTYYPMCIMRWHPENLAINN
jgi:hypothetical protein